MKTTSPLRVLCALVVACGLLLATGTPASASSITSGSLGITKGTLTAQNIALSSTTCPNLSFAADFSSTSTGTMLVTSLTGHIPFLWSGTAYSAAYSLRTGGVAGTYNHTTGVMTGLVVPLRITMRTISTTDPCSIGTTTICTWNTTLTLSSTNLFAHTSSSPFTMTGTGTALALGGTCNAPFSAYTGGAVSATWNVHV